MNYSALVILLITVSFSSYGQEENSDPHRYFGVRIGSTFAHPNFSKGSPPSDFETTWGPGFVAGLSLNVPISEKWSIQPEYLYRQMNSEIEDPKSSLKLSYLSMPLLLKFRFSKKLTVMAGPQFDLLIKGESKSSGQTSNITHQTEERSIAATFGLAYIVWKTVSFEAHYAHGLNHIGISQGDDVTEFKFESIQISVGYGF